MSVWCGLSYGVKHYSFYFHRNEQGFSMCLIDVGISLVHLSLAYCHGNHESYGTVASLPTSLHWLANYLYLFTPDILPGGCMYFIEWDLQFKSIKMGCLQMISSTFQCGVCPNKWMTKMQKPGAIFQLSKILYLLCL